MTTDIYATPTTARNSGSPAELRLCYRSGQPDASRALSVGERAAQPGIRGCRGRPSAQ
jgi:hypothetical protein